MIIKHQLQKSEMGNKSVIIRIKKSVIKIAKQKIEQI